MNNDNKQLLVHKTFNKKMEKTNTIEFIISYDVCSLSWQD